MTITTTLRVGTRGSRLALAQARIAASALQAVAGESEIVPMSTRGDAISRRHPGAGWAESDGQFTRDLESALLRGEVDLVVHSFKDLPTEPVPGLVIAAILERADARDCLLTADGRQLDDLPFCARVGTSSARRAAQLAAARPDLISVPMRGNVETRIARLRAGDLDAVVLAAAGLDRIGIEVPDAARLPYDVMLPAPAQGALALQVRADDAALRSGLERLDHRPTRVAVAAERALLRRIGGGCLAPLGALGEVHDRTLRLRAAYEDRSGELRRAEASGPANDPDRVVEAIAARILAS